MAILDMQRVLGVVPDGWWGKDSQDAYILQGRRLDFNWHYLRRKLSAKFNQSQVDGMYHVLDACNRARLSPQHTAYILATAWHETAHRMQPIAEIGKGKGKRYGTWYKNSKGVVYGIRNGSKPPYPVYLHSEYPHLYYGRGYPQLTWLDNYLRAGKELGVDFANNPELANAPNHSADILVKGSMQGWFTTRSIPDKIKYGHFSEFVAARSVINGSDRAKDIAEIAKNILNGLQLKGM